MTITRPRLIAANDNSPRHADDFAADLSERRAWLTTLPDNYKPVLAWPTAERLARLETPAAAQALYRYAELMAPHREVVANDNNPDVAAPVGDPDMVHETRPSANEVLKAASDGLRCRVVSTKVGGRWQITSRHSPQYGVTVEGFRLGELLFRAGVMVSYGATERGNPKKPAERARHPKGKKTPPQRSMSSIRFLLPANDNTPIANGASWLGGITRPRGNTGRPDDGENEAAIEMDRGRRRDAIRLALGLDAAVLDAAITDATAQQIGAAFGYSGKTAERRGMEKINTAIKKLQEIAA